MRLSTKITLPDTWPEWLYVVLLFVLCCISVTTLPLMKDEGIRLLTTAEMQHYGTYWTPTLYSELYLNKLPLFNWILLLGTSIGGLHLVTFRIVSVLLFFLFGGLVYRATQSRLGKKTALLAGILSLSIARIQFWSGSQCLVDSLYASFCFLQLYSLIHFLDKEAPKKAFWYSYLAMALGFMTKGLPSLVFQVLGLGICFFIYPKKRFFQLQHLLAMLGSFALVALYFGIYQLQHPTATYWLLHTQFMQVSEKVNNPGLLPYLLNFLENIGQLLIDGLPALFLLIPAGIILFYKGKWRHYLRQPFVVALVLVFAFTVALFLQSYHFRTRYVYGLYPLLIIALLVITKSVLKPRHYRPIWILLLVGKIAYISLVMPNQAAAATAKVNNAAIAQSIHEYATTRQLAFLHAPPKLEPQQFYFTKVSAYLAVEYDRYIQIINQVDKNYVYLVEKQDWNVLQKQHPTLKLLEQYEVEHGYVIGVWEH